MERLARSTSPSAHRTLDIVLDEDVEGEQARSRAPEPYSRRQLSEPDPSTGQTVPAGALVVRLILLLTRGGRTTLVKTQIPTEQFRRRTP